MATRQARPTAASASRSIWKGAISFGLVHVPVSLHSATDEQEVDFDWLDKRTMDPVGYKRINKRTGKEIEQANIVKGVKIEGGDYVVLSDDEIKAAYPKRTQTIAIETFVKATDVSFFYTEKPYYLAPEGKADRVYALLREALTQAGVIGIARFVLHNKEHLAALVPAGPALMLGILRWAAEIRSPDGLYLPKVGVAANSLKPAEMKMAGQLIAEMTTTWKPTDYEDEFTSAVRELVAKKAKAGDKAKVEPLEETPDVAGSNVIDLSDLLKQSLNSKAGGRKASSGAARAAAGTAQKTGKKPARAPAKKAAAGRRKAA
ncbi:Ku protein [Paucibacter sp. R3-3]|uniref:Non-homologous end joining protein Ku n=1 Tax=Roseateles agri TaxID=3098619 RepID=A0ABU5DPM6_9BURK|nr:Ku protein [Paucibacter sp. R3-3]MDY0747600.1 Ku protein [Paucibacter sp. R3-3]